MGYFNVVFGVCVQYFYLESVWLQTRKLNLIAYLAQLQDEIFFEKLERYILKREKELHSEFNPFTLDELINRIEKSELDFKAGRFKSQEDLEKISSNW